MRLTMSLLGLVAVAGISAVPIQEAAADGIKKRTVVRKVVEKEHYSFDVDPYAYRYSPRGYYPYYNSAYWSSARLVRERNHAHYYEWIQIRPPYFKAWGHPRKDWNQRRWHAEHHGYIWRHHW